MNSAKHQKDKIRERYKGLAEEELFCIPAKEQKSVFHSANIINVAAYARVSTDGINQTSSYELQRNYYTDYINKNANWRFVGIYADEGITGTQYIHREEFIKMINDAKADKIDLIVTKSVSRFARNTVDCIGIIRELRNKKKPTYIYFETEGINTQDDNYEMALSFCATIAQEESHMKSNIMNSSIEMRFKRGIFLTPPLLGYDKDENGNLVINEEESKTVKLIFYLYLSGSSTQQIANTLMEYGRLTKKGNTKWSQSTVLQILQNERHCGDIIARKTWTPNYLDHKSKKNKNDRNMHGRRDNHEAIISRDDFLAVQKIIKNSKYGHKGFLPELKVINDGVLKGFVSINTSWANFTPEDYITASLSAYSSEEIDDVIEINAQKGEFDYRKFEIVRNQYVNSLNQVSVTFTPEKVFFSTECFKKFNYTPYIEMLINPTKNLLAVRNVDNTKCRNAIKWFRYSKNKINARPIPGTAFLSTLYEILDWDLENKYKIIGQAKSRNEDFLILFDLTETSVLISQSSILINNTEIPKCPLTTSGPKKDLVAYPKVWGNSFGKQYYEQQALKQRTLANNDWKITQEGIKVESHTELNTTSPEQVFNHIEKIKREIQKEVE